MAVAVALFGFADAATGQKDAAEKAKEGGIDHWIEYYKAEKQKPATLPPEPATLPGNAPAKGMDPRAPVPEKTGSK